MNEARAFLKMTGPDNRFTQVIVPPEGMYLGRDPDINDLVLDANMISLRHARFTWQEDTLRIEDLNSTNGIWQGPTRFPKGEPVRLSIGDSIRIGAFHFTLERIEILRTAPPEVPLPVEEPLPPVGEIFSSVVEISPPLPPSSKPTTNGYLPRKPGDISNWLQYLPAIYSEDDFTGRYLLVFESIMMPMFWLVDYFDMFLSPDTAPQEWLSWFASWFDILLLPELPEDRQRRLMSQVGWLFLRRGTKAGLERLLELYFGVKPEIIESTDRDCHFTVRLALSQSSIRLGSDVVDRLIRSQKPAFADYSLEII